ncbi:MAG TPA: sensor histidine kinase [Noviherbaspirillum sp.]|nr:sensor histidine kinase [Noviherbaspirillum sp.]
MSTASSYFEFASDLSSKFVRIAPEKMDDEIRHALQRIIDFFAVDCCAIYQSHGNEDDVVLVQGIDARRMTSAYSSYSGRDVPTPVLQIFRDVLRNKQTFCLHRPDDLPPWAEKDRALLAHCGLESLLLVPISTSASTDYLFMLASACNRQAWSKEHVSQMRLLAEILVNTMCRSSMQKALQRTARDLSEAQRIYRLGSWEWDIGSGRIVKMAAVDRILGIKPDTQASFVELVHASDRNLLQKAIDNALCNNGSELLIEYRIRTRRGDIRIARSRFEVARSDSGSRMIGTFQDVTNARRSEQELQLLRSQYWHADRVAHTGVLVASLAHELSQPLTATLSNAQAGLRLLSRVPLDQQEIFDILTDIVADNRRARHIIDALRGMIRGGETGRVRIDATDIIREVLALLHSEFVAQQVEVNLACSGACFVQADKAQIEQVLLNLMLNSVESMRSQPADKRRIQLQVKRNDGDEVQVSISDTGVGIPRDQLGSVFDAFWTTKAHGLGMGLAICRSIIEAHGGRIWAECNSDQGAIFLLRLPLAA